MWGQFNCGDGTAVGCRAARNVAASIRRGSSQGMCRALQLRITGVPRTGVYPSWGVDAIVLKVVLTEVPLMAR